MMESDRLRAEVARARRVAVLLNDAHSRETLEEYVRELERRAAEDAAAQNVTI